MVVYANTIPNPRAVTASKREQNTWHHATMMNSLVVLGCTLFAYTTMLAPQRLSRHAVHTKCMTVEIPGASELLDGLLQFTITDRFWTVTGI